MAKKWFLRSIIVWTIVIPEICIAQSSAEKDAQSLLSAFMSYTDLRMRSVQQSLEILASTTEVKSGKWENMKGLLDIYQKSDGKLAVWYVLPDGRYYTVDKGLMDVKLSDRSYFADLMAGKKIIGSLVVSKSTGQRSAVTAIPIKEGDKVIAGIGASLFLEKLSEAKKRKARIYAEIVGYASNCDADNLLSPNQAAQEEALRSALKSAGVDPADINYINSHGTGTQLNDLVETNAIKNVFKKESYSIPINSTKSLIGHTMGASGAIEAVAVCLSINSGVIHPTINYIDRDPLCDLYYVPNSAMRKEIRYAISNSFGMGGNNAALVFRRCDDN